MLPFRWKIAFRNPMCKATSGDSTQLIFLRARWYNPADGRLQSRDTWGGNVKSPMSYNAWLYAYANPLTYVDPTGHYNRQVAIQWAMAHDLMDPFPEGANYRKSGIYGQTDCAAFASSVLSRGGVTDSRGAPPFDGTIYTDYDKTDSKIRHGS